MNIINLVDEKIVVAKLTAEEIMALILKPKGSK